MPTDRVLIAVGYGGGLRVSELVALIWSRVIERPDGKVQLDVLGKGNKSRQVLPTGSRRQVAAVATWRRRRRRSGVSIRKTGGHLTERAVNFMLKAAAKRAGLNPKFSAHWLRHAHASHAIDRGAALPVVQSTLGHGNVAVTSGLSARPPGGLERPAPRCCGVSSPMTINPRGRNGNDD